MTLKIYRNETLSSPNMKTAESYYDGHGEGTIIQSPTKKIFRIFFFDTPKEKSNFSIYRLVVTSNKVQDIIEKMEEKTSKLVEDLFCIFLDLSGALRLQRIDSDNLREEDGRTLVATTSGWDTETMPVLPQSLQKSLASLQRAGTLATMLAKTSDLSESSRVGSITERKTVAFREPDDQGITSPIELKVCILTGRPCKLQDGRYAIEKTYASDSLITLQRIVFKNPAVTLKDIFAKVSERFQVKVQSLYGLGPEFEATIWKKPKTTVTRLFLVEEVQGISPFQTYFATTTLPPEND